MSSQNVNDMRLKILSGYTPTEEEMNEILKQMIGERTAMLTATAGKEKAKKSSKSTPIDFGDLLGEGENNEGV